MAATQAWLEMSLPSSESALLESGDLIRIRKRLRQFTNGGSTCSFRFATIRGAKQNLLNECNRDIPSYTAIE